jgi:tRNA dimethylallyltransferase
MPRFPGHFYFVFMKKNLIVILGPTASGKTKLAGKLAYDLRGEVISADSRQVYRGMDIGTGKDLSEFHRGGEIIPRHLIDILEPSQEFNVFEFKKGFYGIFNALRERRVLPVLVGGTGLYLESVLTDYNMPYVPSDELFRQEAASKSLTELREILLEMKTELHNKTDLEDRERLIRKIEIEKAKLHATGKQMQNYFIHAVVFGVHWERSVLRRRIADRLHKRMAEGMIEEVFQLHEKGLSWERLDGFGLEYRYISRYLQNMMTKDEMAFRLQIAIGQFAKRQMTWFRRMEKKGVSIEWIPGDDYHILHQRVMDVLS